MKHTAKTEDQNLSRTFAPQEQEVDSPKEDPGAHLVDFWEMLAELRI